ncbi:hypothetical protein KFL_008220010 [Klebsormidium nitens]|uniref:RRM domain-containing protein n=1 Tax=Klebsormidium nitens TaxID=105231 RepID=A0A1Y1IL87_KLENI|nr:hypothetical protein KFL_008220010 [Klebsormidium nitens]|eukprot:GAQ91630.1 hypothetical protein KFL_008220010 [Klebsormidium nitens]
MGDDTDEGCRVFVGGLSWKTSSKGLQDAFATYGRVLDAKVVCDHQSGRSRGFGFVTFRDKGSVQAAIKHLDALQLDGRRVTVRRARPRGTERQENNTRLEDGGKGGRGAERGCCHKCGARGHYAHGCHSGAGGGVGGANRGGGESGGGSGYGGLRSAEQCEEYHAEQEERSRGPPSWSGKKRARGYSSEDEAGQDRTGPCRGGAKERGGVATPRNFESTRAPNPLERRHRKGLRDGCLSRGGPEARRTERGLDTREGIIEHLRIVGRKDAFLSWLAWVAKIYSNWRRRTPWVDDRDYTRLTVHLLLLGCPGSGKTTFLYHSLRWLQEWLRPDTPEAEAHRLDYLAGAIYSERATRLESGQLKLVKDLLVALHTAAGSNGVHAFGVLRVEQTSLTDTDAEKMVRIIGRHAPALRLLYSLLSPLDGPAEDEFEDEEEELFSSYSTFLGDYCGSAPDYVQECISIEAVLAFARRGLGVPQEQLLLVLLLIDEGNTASGVFPRESPSKTKKHLTWLKEFLSVIIRTNNEAKRDLIIPTTATTRRASTDLECTASGHAQAAYVPLKALSVPERKRLICDIATRVAKALKRSRVGVKDLSIALNDALDFVGGNPSLMSWLLEELGGPSWHEDLDLVVKSMDYTKLLVKLGRLKKAKRAARKRKGGAGEAPPFTGAIRRKSKTERN